MLFRSLYSFLPLLRPLQFLCVILAGYFELIEGRFESNSVGSRAATHELRAAPPPEPHRLALKGFSSSCIPSTSYSLARPSPLARITTVSQREWLPGLCSSLSPFLGSPSSSPSAPNAPTPSRSLEKPAAALNRYAAAGVLHSR
mgnify:CR=1 FL=1